MAAVREAERPPVANSIVDKVDKLEARITQLKMKIAVNQKRASAVHADVLAAASSPSSPVAGGASGPPQPPQPPPAMYGPAVASALTLVARQNQSKVDVDQGEQEEGSIARQHRPIWSRLASRLVYRDFQEERAILLAAMAEKMEAMRRLVFIRDAPVVSPPIASWTAKASRAAAVVAGKHAAGQSIRAPPTPDESEESDSEESEDSESESAA